MENKDKEENGEDMVYILSLLKNVKSPNRFTDDQLKGDTEGCLTTSSNTSAGMGFSDDSNTNDSNSHSSSGDFADEQQLVDNFNKVRTGHKLDDYILSILKSENCKKKFYFENDTNLSRPFQSSDTIKVSANSETDSYVYSKGSQDLLEASDILYKHRFPSHKLDEVLQVALKVDKPIKTYAAQVSSSEKEKLDVSLCDEPNSKSASKYICSVCKFAFNSEDNRNRHMSNEHIKRIPKGKHPLKLRKNTNQWHKLPEDTHETSDAHSDVNNCVVKLPTVDHRMRKEFRKGNLKDTCAPVKTNGLSFKKDTAYSDHMSSTGDVEDLTESKSTSGSFTCSVETSNTTRNSDGMQCCMTKTFSEHIKVLNTNRKNRRGNEIANQSNTNNLVCIGSNGNANSHNDLSFFPSEDSCPKSGNSNISLSSLSVSSAVKLTSSLQPHNTYLSFEPALPPQLPASSVHLPSTLLKEKHWIINDSSNKFGGPHSIEEKKQQGNLIKSEDLVGIRSIDESHKAASLTQCFVSFSDSSNGSRVDISDLNRTCSLNRSNISVKNCDISVHGSSFKDCEATTKQQGSENAKQEWSSTCARHLTILDYLSHYDSYKLLTFKDESSLPMEPHKSELYSQNTNSSEEKDMTDSHSRDLILSPPKKRWKSYISHN